MSKKKAYQKKSFESTGTTNDVSSNIYMSMILSEAWQDLSTKQQNLYLYMKLQYYGQSGKRAVDKEDITKFYFNRALWQNIYKLYARGSENRFYKDVTSLISHGFIICLESGKTTRTKNIYKFSSKWQKYNTQEFEILPNEMNYPLSKSHSVQNKKV